MHSQRSCFIPWGSEEHIKDDFEILIGAEACWASAIADDIPDNAFPAGTSEQGDTLYIGRAEYENSIIVGKIHRRYKLCYLPYKGKEIEIIEYEILVA